MGELSFNAVQHLQFVHDFPCVARIADSSDSPVWAIWQELVDGGYIFECQGYTECEGELIEAGMGYDITPLGNAYLLEFAKKFEARDVTSIYLNKNELKLLKKLGRSVERELKIEDEVLNPLFLAGVVSFRYEEDKNYIGNCVAVCKITNVGKRYLDYRRETETRTWVPIMISIFALIASIVFPLILAA